MRKPRSSTRDEYDKVKDAIQKLRSENRKLRKENSRLQKELRRIPDIELDRQIDLEDEEAGLVEVVQEAPTCPKCKSEDFSVVPAGRYIIKLCRSCGFRKRSEVGK